MMNNFRLLPDHYDRNLCSWLTFYFVKLTFMNLKLIIANKIHFYFSGKLSTKHQNTSIDPRNGSDLEF